jgi:uncharacterized protein (DUF302 family)
VISQPCDGTIDQVLRRAVARIEALGHDVLAVIDHSGEAADADLTMPDTKLILFGSPRPATALMLSHPRVAIDLPLKLLISATGEGALISYNAPDYLAQRHGLNGDEADPLRIVATVARAAGSIR